MTDSEIIEMLGGTVAVAKACDVHHTAVTNWKNRGISRAGRYQIKDLAKRRRLALPEDFMGRNQKRK